MRGTQCKLLAGKVRELTEGFELQELPRKAGEAERVVGWGSDRVEARWDQLFE